MLCVACVVVCVRLSLCDCVCVVSVVLWFVVLPCYVGGCVFGLIVFSVGVCRSVVCVVVCGLCSVVFELLMSCAVVVCVCRFVMIGV